MLLCREFSISDQSQILTVTFQVGGGYGYDLARSGHDLEDVHYLDLNSWEWSKVELTNQPSDSRWSGHCVGHSLQHWTHLRAITQNALDLVLLSLMHSRCLYSHAHYIHIFMCSLLIHALCDVKVLKVPWLLRISVEFKLSCKSTCLWLLFIFY
jgi:hypothetical protein